MNHGLKLFAFLALAGCASVSPQPPSVPQVSLLLPAQPDAPEENELLLELRLRAEAKGQGPSDDLFLPFYGAWVDEVHEDGSRSFVGIARCEEGLLFLPDLAPGEYELELYSGWESKGIKVIDCLSTPRTVEQLRAEGLVRHAGWEGRTCNTKRSCRVLTSGQVVPDVLDFR